MFLQTKLLAIDAVEQWPEKKQSGKSFATLKRSGAFFADASYSDAPSPETAPELYSVPENITHKVSNVFIRSSIYSFAPITRPATSTLLCAIKNTTHFRIPLLSPIHSSFCSPVFSAYFSLFRISPIACSQRLSQLSKRLELGSTLVSSGSAAMGMSCRSSRAPGTSRPLLLSRHTTRRC